MNNVDVAKALERPPAYLIKYYGCELGAQTKYDDKTGTSIVNGAHQTQTIADLLEGFIKKYVQCYSCGNPETVVNIDKRDNIFLKCKACGAVSNVDMRHKLNTFILKNPPEAKISKAEKKIKKKMAEATGVDDEDDAPKKEKTKKDKKEKKEKKDKKKDKKDKKKGSDDGDESEEPSMRSEQAGAPDVEEEDGEDDETEWMTDTSAAAVAARVQQQLTGVTAGMVTVGNLEEEMAAKKKAEKEARKAEKAARKAAKEAAKKMSDMSVNSESSGAEHEEDDEEEDDDDIDIPALRKYILSRSPEDAATALSKMEVPGGGVGTQRLMWDTVFGGDDEPLSGKIADKADYIKAHLSDANSQLVMLGGLEHFVTVASPDQIKELPKVLKVLYDMDICDEEVILAWNKRTAIAEAVGVTEKHAEAARYAASPLIKWLEEADEDSDEE